MNKKLLKTLFLPLGISLILCTACGKGGSPAAPSTAAAPETSSAAETSAAAAPSAQTAPEVSSAAGETAEEPTIPADAVPLASGVSEKEFADNVASQYLSDEDFIANVRYGLEQRWGMVASQDGSSMKTSDFREYASAAVNAELDGIGDLVYYSFEDQNLNGLASSYYSALQDQLQGIREAESQDALAQSEVYMRGFCVRTIVLHELKENYGLTVSGQYAGNLEQAVARYEDALSYLGIK